jgi:hypothetical protein
MAEYSDDLSAYLTAVEMVLCWVDLLAEYK